MSRKKRKNIVPVSLTLEQRHALWVSLDLLRELLPSAQPKLDVKMISSFCDDLYSMDGDPQIYTIEFTAAGHRACGIALKYARLYLDGNRQYFYDPILPQLEQELGELSADIRVLAAFFLGDDSLP